MKNCAIVALMNDFYAFKQAWQSRMLTQTLVDDWTDAFTCLHKQTLMGSLENYKWSPTFLIKVALHGREWKQQSKHDEMQERISPSLLVLPLCPTVDTFLINTITNEPLLIQRRWK